jgi:hypothetical protein
MFGWGPGGWNFFEIWGMVASWVAGFFLFLIWLAVVVLFVRFLLIGTRAAKLYLRNQGAHDGVLPNRSAAPAASAAAPAATAPTTATKPAPRAPRPPKPSV